MSFLKPANLLPRCFGMGLSLLVLPHLALAQTADAPTNTTPGAQTPTQEDIDAKIKSIDDRLDALNQVSLEPLQLGNTPGLTSSVPTALGLPNNSIAIGLGYQERIRFSDAQDGAVGIVYGLSERSGRTGLNIGFTVLELTGRTRGSFGSRGSFNFKLHHRLNDRSYVALGLENVLSYGSTDLDESAYGVYTYRLDTRNDANKPFSRVYLNLGVGNGRFRSEEDVFRGRVSRLDNGPINVFGSLTTNVAPRVNAFTEWTGQDANVGLSIVPFKKVPLIVVPSVVDLTGSAGNGSRFTLGLAYGFSPR